jgi:hypothetical protein
VHRHENEYEFNLEQAYASIIPAENLMINLGKERLNVGNNNIECPHEWEYVTKPKVLEYYFGEESLTGEGVSVAYRMPFLNNLLISGGIYNSSNTIEHLEHDEHIHHDLESQGFHNQIYSGRASLDINLGRTTLFLIGINGVFGEFGNEHASHSANLYGIDFSLGKEIGGDFINLQGEFYNLENVNYPKSKGFFLFGSYSFENKLSLGLRYDNVKYPFENNVRENALSSIISYRVNHFSKLRLQYEVDTQYEEQSLYLQIVFHLDDE